MHSDNPPVGRNIFRRSSSLSEVPQITISLVKDWDSPPSLPHLNQTGRFVGREKEISAIGNFIDRRDSSTVLLTGHRGVGKTSIVRALLRKVGEQKKANVIVMPVYITGPLLTDAKGDSISSMHFLRIVSTRLYNSSLLKKLDKDLSALIEANYKKATASEFKATEDQSDEQISNSSKVVESILKFTIPELGKFFMAGAIGCLGFFGFQQTDLPSWGKAGLSFLSLISPWVAATYWRSSHTISTTERRKSESASERYNYDNSAINIEYDLERIHEHLYANGIKLVYVFDELDKVPSRTVSDLISEFKNFFTLGFANYLFVTGDDFLEKVPKYGDRKRNIDYTLYNVHFHISRPSILEIERFLKEVISSSKIVGFDDVTEDDLINYFLFESKCDYYDLILKLQNHVTGHVKDCPIVDFQKVATAEVKAKSRLQQCIKMVFENKYYSELKDQWFLNDQILRSLYDFANETLISTNSDFQNWRDSHSYMEFLAVRDLSLLLNRLEYIAFAGETPRAEFDRTITVVKYQNTNDFSKAVPATLDFLSQWEEDYLSEFESAVGKIVWIFRIANILNPTLNLKETQEEIISDIDNQIQIAAQISLGFGHLKNCSDVYCELKKESPKTFKSDEIEARMKEIKIEVAKIDNQGQTILAQSLFKHLQTLKPNNKNQSINQNSWQKVSPDIHEDFRNRIVNQRNQILTDHKNLHSIVIVNQNQDDVFNGITQLTKDPKSDRYRCLTIGKSGSDSMCEIPTDADTADFAQEVSDIFQWYVQET
jgi:Cdc6-like AAA superfamily ATPase